MRPETVRGMRDKNRKGGQIKAEWKTRRLSETEKKRYKVREAGTDLG